MTPDPLSRLRALGRELPTPPRPGGRYVPVRISGDRALVAAQFPIGADGSIPYKGRIGRELTTADGIAAAELAALNVLAQMHAAVGLERIAALDRFEAFLVTDDGWDEFPKVVDGASSLFLAVLGDDVGRHARALFGVHRLPLGMPLELTASFTIGGREPTRGASLVTMSECDFWRCRSCGATNRKNVSTGMPHENVGDGYYLSRVWHADARCTGCGAVTPGGEILSGALDDTRAGCAAQLEGSSLLLGVFVGWIPGALLGAALYQVGTRGQLLVTLGVMAGVAAAHRLLLLALRGTAPLP